MFLLNRQTSDRHNPYQAKGSIILCDTCQEFERAFVAHLHLRKKGKVGVQYARTIELKPSFEALISSARNGCHVCRSWGFALTNECLTPSALNSLQTSPAPILATTPTTTVLRSPNGFLENQEAHLFKIWSTVLVNMRLSDISLADFNSMMNRGSNEARLIEIAQRWIDQCHDSHKACREHDLNENLPTRLLKLNDGAVQLVDGAALGKVAYVALSYCWGGDQIFKLTLKAESSLREGVEIAKLSRTLQQAVSICLQLKISYMWIDALCIVQDDDGQDWISEASKMQQVYGQAHFTLSICSAPNASEGFLSDRWPADLSIDLKRARIVDLLPMPALKSLKDIRVSSPLASRGWIFQEELLSPRILYWSDQGIFWSCSAAIYAEHGAAVTESDRQAMKTSNRTLDPHEFRTTNDPLLLWDDMISAFSTRDFTIDEDRLPAVSGLARLVQQATGEEYLYGLWKSRLPAQLLWVVTDPLQNAKSRPIRSNAEMSRMPEFQPPSWSWASISPGRQIIMPKQASSRARLVERSVGDSDRRIHLVGRGRWLTDDLQHLTNWPDGVETESRQLRFPSLKNRAGIWASNAQQQTILVCLDWRRPIVINLDLGLPLSFDQLLCLEINYMGLLLLEKSSVNETVIYKRIGCAQIHHEPSFFAAAEPMEITIE